MSCLSTNPSALHLPGGYAAEEVGEGRAPPTAQDQGHATSEALATTALAPRAWPRSDHDAWVFGQVSQGSSPSKGLSGFGTDTKAEDLEGPNLRRWSGGYVGGSCCLPDSHEGEYFLPCKCHV